MSPLTDQPDQPARGPSPAIPPSRGFGRRLGSVSRAAAAAVDVVIVAYAVALVVWLAGGALALGAVIPDHAEKPLLILFMAIPLRAALGGRSWLIDGLASVAGPGLAGLRRLAARVPPAVADVAFACAVTRLATIPVAFVANLLFPPWRARAFAMPFRYERFAEIFAAWDSGWYFDIARHGYYWRPDGQSSIAFFPLYPMLMRIVAWPFGGSDAAVWASGVAVSCTAFALALLLLHRFAERVSGSRECARRTVLYVAIFPFSFFFTRVYAESVFLLTSVLAISRAHEARWWQAGAWAGLATLARPNGVLVVLPLALMAIGDRPSARTLIGRSAALLLAPLALAGFSAYVYTLSGNPLGWLAAQSQWGYSLGHAPWQLLLKMIGRMIKHGPYDYFFLSKLAPFRLFHGITALVFLVLTPAIFRRFGPALGAYVLVSLLVPLSGNALEGIGRYAAVLFPAFMLMGSARSRWVHEGILIISGLFLALLDSLFVTLRPIY